MMSRRNGAPMRSEKCLWRLMLVALLFCVHLSAVGAFLQHTNHDRILKTSRGSFQENIRTVCHVAVPDAAPSFSMTPSQQRTITAPVKSRNRRKPIRRDEDRWERAEKVEERMLKSLEAMESVVRRRDDDEPEHVVTVLPPPFPSVRDCNAALATFGDGGEFLRALRLFVKMRKAASLANGRFHLQLEWKVPAPTLVTYSTLMSRAVHVDRPQVALRLWNLMKLQGEFWSNPREIGSSSSGTILIPDVKAANILMNAHAKLGNAQQAFDLMRQMQYGNGTDVPATRPNIVTYNTLLDACHKAGDLDAALQAKQQLDAQSHIEPDARTYTSLIATVARKPSTASGANDPSLAFEFLQEMKQSNISANGMTYSALIDACGRCRRPDLALQGLRIMLRQKQSNGQVLPNEVGAWTAAIDACGKSGRIQTARRLFWSMTSNKFGVQPNTITCGCLTDCLLKNGKTAETLEVLRYMKREGIFPSEVMYTSLMTSAEKLVQIENQNPVQETTSGNGSAKAIEVYTELMLSLMQGNGKTNAKSRYHTDSNSLLVKVFLVFQEMKEVGATPDLACYNALLRACARAGDTNMAKDVLRRIRNDGLHPNDTSWRELIRAAAKHGQSEAAEAMWMAALAYRGDDDEPAIWQPSAISFGALASAYLRDAASAHSVDTKKELYSKVITMYKDVVIGKEDHRLHLIGRDALEDNPRSMLLVLQALVGLSELTPKRPQILRKLATSIVQLDCFAANDGGQSSHLMRDNRAASRALAIAQSWLNEDTTSTIKQQ